MNRRMPDLGLAVRRLLPAAATLALVALLATCGGDSTGPTPPPTIKPGTDLLFLRPAAGSPPLLTRDTSFVATRGQSKTVELFYEDPENPGQPGQRFLRFKLEDNSLLRYPASHPMAGADFQPGDTITITIHVPQDTLLADFGPSGLRFDPNAPAELEMRWAEADRDFDEDGSDDPQLEGDIDLWKQEQAGQPWTRVGTAKDVSLEEVKAEVTGFTTWALAI